MAWSSVFSRVGERIQAGGDESLDALREVAERSSCPDEPGELLGVQGISPCARQELRARVRVQHRAVEERMHEICCLVVRQRAEGEGDRIRLAAAPAHPALEQLGPGCPDDQDRHPGRPADEVVDEVEERVVGPVQILEHENERALLGLSLQEPSPGGECLGSPILRSALSFESHERTQVSLERASILVLRDRLHGCSKLRLRLLRAVCLQDPRLRLHHLTERPEGDPFSIRQ